MLRDNRWQSSFLIVLVLVWAVACCSMADGNASDEPDKSLVEAIEHLEKIVKQDGPESIKFPWDPKKHAIDIYAANPEFTSYWVFTPKVAEAPRVRLRDGLTTSSIFVGVKRVGERFKVENWRVSWEKKGEKCVARSKEVVQTFDEFLIPFNKGKTTKGRVFPRDIYEFENMEFEHDCMRFSIDRGRVVVVKADGLTVAAYVSGNGKLWYTPPRQLASDVPDSDREVQQLERFLEVKSLDATEFKDVLIYGHPEWMKSFLDRVELKPVKEDAELEEKSRELFATRLYPAMEEEGLAFDGSDRPICLVSSSPDFFHFEFDTVKHDLVSYLHDPTEVREITLGGRAEMQLSRIEYKNRKAYCKYDEPDQRKEKSRHQLEHECKDEVKTVSWSADVVFKKGIMDTVKKGQFRTVFEYETLIPNASYASFDFWALEPTALGDAGDNDILFFDMGWQILVPVEPVDARAGRMNVLYAEGIEFINWGIPVWVRTWFGLTTCKIARCMDGWLPDTGYLDCTEFRLSVTVPEKYELASVGRIADEVVAEGYRTRSWVGERCVRFPGFVVGEFSRFEYNLDGTPLIVFAETSSAATKYVLPEIESSLKFYSKLFSEYPYSKLSVCPVNWSHGRGFASLVTVMGWSAGYFRNANLGDTQAGVYCHEVSHQWWGNIVGWFSPDDQWLSEGFAEMSTLMYLQSARDNKSVEHRLKDWGYNAKRLDEKGAICLGGPRLGRRAYFELVYHKGAYVMHTLRMMVGDEDMIRILRTFVEQFKWERPTTSDFREVCELTLGRDKLMELGGEPSLHWFFDQWIYNNGYPKYEFDWKKRKAQDGSWEVVCTVKQVGEKLFKMPLPIWVYTKDDQRLLSRKLVFEKEHEFVLSVPSKPKKVVLDEFNSVLCDIKQ